VLSDIPDSQEKAEVEDEEMVLTRFFTAIAPMIGRNPFITRL